MEVNFLVPNFDEQLCSTLNCCPLNYRHEDGINRFPQIFNKYRKSIFHCKFKLANKILLAKPDNLPLSNLKMAAVESLLLSSSKILYSLISSKYDLGVV
eukprot:CCRYP_006873-RE/>CCRYP_006873-RE protein AED:0.49 eAED:0.67 QI:0/0/0/1/0/0/2/0/98